MKIEDIWRLQIGELVFYFDSCEFLGKPNDQIAIDHKKGLVCR